MLAAKANQIDAKGLLALSGDVDNGLELLLPFTSPVGSLPSMSDHLLK